MPAYRRRRGSSSLAKPLVELKPNGFADNADGKFVDGTGEAAGITLADTAGSAAQIIAAAGLGAGHSKFGISRGELMEWPTRSRGRCAPRRAGG